MVQTAENSSRSYPAIGWQLMAMVAWARPRSTTRIRDAGSQARMWSSPIVVGNPLPQDLPKMHLTQRDHAIQTFTANRSHQPFTVSIRLRRLHRCSQNFEPECPQVVVNFCRKDRIPIMNQESVDVIARDGFSKLLQGPGGSRMGRNIAVQNAATSHFHHHEHVQHSEAGRDCHQKITRHDDLSVIADKRPPVLRGCSPTASRITILRPGAKKAGVEGAELHRHRKTYADTLHEEGVSVNTIRIRLGHESLDVTLAYLKGKDAESEEAQEHANSSSLALYA